jgi:hypothetical protein
MTVARVHSKSQPCSSNQCDTARLESKLIRRFKMMFISSHEIEHSFSNEAQRLVYRRLRRRTKRRLRDTRSVADSHLVHSSTLISSSFLHSSHNCQDNTILVPLTIFVITAHICTMIMQFDHDEFLPPFVKLSTSPYCTNISSQYDGTRYNDNSQHGARYNSTERTPLPLPGESQRTVSGRARIEV